MVIIVPSLVTISCLSSVILLAIRDRCGGRSRICLTGLIRDTMGNWLTGFSCYVGFTANTMVERIAIEYGVAMAWRMGYQSLSLESDSVGQKLTGLIRHVLRANLGSHQQVSDLEWLDPRLGLNRLPFAYLFRE
ncbi:unnamed protein product [Dovyalis caffra]|uniref:RNase H type-1 domain-containing protein n=1 Tax=Dovyalis caffra TaxID=77055 RepID=A0AAV1SSY9_9ROSI|nr:unnamed protein product [Dovyalis caffra]